MGNNTNTNPLDELERCTVRKNEKGKETIFSLDDPRSEKKNKANVDVGKKRACQQIHVDDYKGSKGLPIQGVHCDWCIRDIDQGKCLFVELKGRHYEDGIMQIQNTIAWFQLRIPNFQCKHSYVVMSNRCPKDNIDRENLVAKFKNNTDSLLHFVHSGVTIKFK